MQAGIFRQQMAWETNYTTAPNEWLRDDRISFKAKGILLYLLSHEVGYNITFAQIERQTKDGLSAIRSGIEELVEAGYLEVQQTRDENGYNAGLAYLLKNPECENPTLENPTLENPTLENRIAYKKQTNKETNDIRTKNNKNSEVDFETEFEQFWNLYPRHTSRPEALKSFIKARAKLSLEALLEATERYANDPNREPAYTKMPATWLNQECWADEPIPAKTRPQTRQDKIAEAEANFMAKLNQPQQITDWNFFG